MFVNVHMQLLTVSMCTSERLHTHIPVHVFVCTHAHLFVCMSLCGYIHRNNGVHACVCVFILVCARVYMYNSYVCLPVYVCAHIYM